MRGEVLSARVNFNPKGIVELGYETRGEPLRPHRFSGFTPASLRH